jgi:hypothetical protein
LLFVDYLFRLRLIELLDLGRVRNSGKVGAALKPVQCLVEDPLNHTRIVVTETEVVIQVTKKHPSAMGSPARCFYVGWLQYFKVDPSKNYGSSELPLLRQGFPHRLAKPLPNGHAAVTTPA